MGHVLTLLYAPLVARLSRRARLPWPQRPARDGLTVLDGVLAVVLGLLVAPVATAWLAPFTIPGTRVLGSPDFGEYCWHVGLFVFDAMHEWGVNRSKLAGLPAGLLAPSIGVMDSLLVSAVGSLGVVVGSVYLWARALHGRSAGIAAAILVGAVGPLAVLGRMVTFYPEVTAGLTLASAGAACALRWRTPFTVALAGIGAGIALLVDVRGLLWALPAVGLAALAVGVGTRGRRWAAPLRAVALVVPLVVSFQWAWWAFEPDSRTLEGSVAIYDELALEGIPLPSVRPIPNARQNFLWGYSNPLHIPDTLQYLRAQSDYIPSWYHQQPQVRSGWRRSGAPWLPPFLAAVGIAAVGLRKRPLLLLALAGTTFPFLVSMQGAVVMKTSNLRFVASALVFLPVVLGVAVGVLVDGPLGTRGPARDAPGRPLPLLVLAVVLAGAVLGVPSTFLSPAADWRIPYPSAESAFRTAIQVRSEQATTGDAGMRMCVFGLTRVEGDGTLIGSLPGGGTAVDGYSRFK